MRIKLIGKATDVCSLDVDVVDVVYFASDLEIHITHQQTSVTPEFDANFFFRFFLTFK